MTSTKPVFTDEEKLFLDTMKMGLSLAQMAVIPRGSPINTRTIQGLFCLLHDKDMHDTVELVKTYGTVKAKYTLGIMGIKDNTYIPVNSNNVPTVNALTLLLSKEYPKNV